jgi:predicted ATP-grasp superfamily ATP-dependent carboligase
MHVFLYEWVTGGGLVEQPGRLPPSMLAEGSAMISALAADFAALPGVRVTAFRDMRLDDLPLDGCEVVEIESASQRRDQFDRLAAAADWTMVVAPEFDCILRDALRRVRSAKGRMLNADDEFVALASNKHLTAEHLRRCGIPTPCGRLLEADALRLPADFGYPAVLKPVDGAGSQHTLLVDGAADEPPPYPWPRRLERYCRGRAASVAALCGPGHIRMLPPCWQRLSEDGRFAYRGGATIAEASVANRADSLAHRALAAMPPARGFVGVDLVLGDDAAETSDYVIEINPRLTTSYVGLRAAVVENLAQAILDAADGRASPLTRCGEPVEFSAGGAVWAASRDDRVANDLAWT